MTPTHNPEYKPFKTKKIFKKFDSAPEAFIPSYN